MAVMNSKPSKEEQPKSPRKGLVFRPSRRTKRQNDDEMREETTPVSTVESPSEQDRSFKYPSQPSRQLQLEPGARGNELPERTVVRLTQPPSAREAAFSGPPRFDWIDVETAAAIKIQTVYRRNKAMDVLERQGCSTVAIRNRSRRRKAARERSYMDPSELFACCGIGFVLGDSSLESKAARKLRQEQYEARQQARVEYEESLRAEYRRKHLAQRTRAGNDDVHEAVEVVE